ncbi:hypothetical protein ACFQY4_45960 [Catellatospora bangladeshensis]|uniref:hypothetical protein n=1 Tax=Catellatospora bangladeshensis TaxID=310355 RepID=UPI0036062173
MTTPVVLKPHWEVVTDGPVTPGALAHRYASHHWATTEVLYGREEITKHWAHVPACQRPEPDQAPPRTAGLTRRAGRSTGARSPAGRHSASPSPSRNPSPSRRRSGDRRGLPAPGRHLPRHAPGRRPAGAVAALAAWVDGRLDDEYADRQYALERAHDYLTWLAYRAEQIGQQRCLWLVPLDAAEPNAPMSGLGTVPIPQFPRR